MFAPTVILNVSVSVAPLRSVHTTSIVEIPSSVGVPENTPVPGLNESQVVEIEFYPKFQAVHVVAPSGSLHAVAV